MKASCLTFHSFSFILFPFRLVIWQVLVIDFWATWSGPCEASYLYYTYIDTYIRAYIHRHIYTYTHTSQLLSPSLAPTARHRCTPPMKSSEEGRKSGQDHNTLRPLASLYALCYLYRMHQSNQEISFCIAVLFFSSLCGCCFQRTGGVVFIAVSLDKSAGSTVNPNPNRTVAQC